ncbi:MAG: phage minor head protein [Promethearchaeota archaeon]
MEFTLKMGISDKTRRKIARKRRHGVKKNITNYSKDIFNAFYDEKLLKETINKTLNNENYLTENLTDAFTDYLKKVNQNIKNLLSKAQEYIEDSYKKGTDRILDENGEKVKIEAEPDEQAIKVLTNEQKRNFESMNKQQTRIVNNIVTKGIEKGKSQEEIAKEIQNRVKQTTKSSANRISRTEIVKSHNVGQVETMQKAGIKYYSFINSPKYTGKDGKTYPCIICRKLQGGRGREHIYLVERAGTSEKNPLPVTQSHPNCNCTTVIRTDKE